MGRDGGVLSFYDYYSFTSFSYLPTTLLSSLLEILNYKLWIQAPAFTSTTFMCLYICMYIYIYIYICMYILACTPNFKLDKLASWIRDLTTVCRGFGMWACECTLCLCGWQYENCRELWGWELWGRFCWDFLLPKTQFRISSTHMRTATRSCLIYTTTNSQTQAYKVQHTLSIAATATLFGKHWHYHLLPVTAKTTLFLQHKVHYQIVCSHLNDETDAKVK